MTRRHIATAVTILAAALVAACGNTPADTTTISAGASGDTGHATSRTVTATGSQHATVRNGSDTHQQPVPADPDGVPAGGITDPTDIDPTDIDPTDPGQVATAAITALHTLDARTDTSPADAYRRAAPWLTGTLLAGFLSTPANGGADWLALVTHRGYTTITGTSITSEYGQPADTTTTAYRTVTYQVTTIYRDGDTPPPVQDTAAHIVLTNTPTGWKVEAFRS